MEGTGAAPIGGFSNDVEYTVIEPDSSLDVTVRIYDGNALASDKKSLPVGDAVDECLERERVASMS